MPSSKKTISIGEQRPLFSLDGVTPLFQRVAADMEPLVAHSQDAYKDVFHGWMLKDLTLVGPYDIPAMAACSAIPEELIGFSEARSKGKSEAAKHQFIHFYLDDYRFECFWTNPKKYLPLLRNYAGVVSPDYSLYQNLPESEKIHNTYRNFLLGAWMQRQGLTVIPNARLSGVNSVPYSLAGVPFRSTLAIGTLGCLQDRDNRVATAEEIRLICQSCSPTALLFYGPVDIAITGYPLEHEIPVFSYKPDAFANVRRKEAA